MPGISCRCLASPDAARLLQTLTGVSCQYLGSPATIYSYLLLLLLPGVPSGYRYVGSLCSSCCLLRLFLVYAAWMEMPSAGISLCICVCLCCIWGCVFLWTAEVLEGDCCLCPAISLFIKLPAPSRLRGGNACLVFQGP